MGGQRAGELGQVDHAELAGPDVLGDDRRDPVAPVGGGEVEVDPAAGLQEPLQALQDERVVGQVLQDAHHADGVVAPARLEGESWYKMVVANPSSRSRAWV